MAAGVVVALAVLFGGRATACQICLPFPTESLADRILAAEHLVLARENPEQPYTLSTVRVLEGEAPPPLELFLDSSSRRWLSFGEDRAILCGWLPEKDGWQHLGRHDETLAPIVREILARREAWQADPGERARYFADLLGHADGTIADLAHLEVAAAPYHQVITFADRVSREQLHEELGDVRRIEWQGLFIILLAQSGHPDDHQLIREKVERNAHWGLSLQAAAWATALIEIDGAAGIDRLAELYLRDPQRDAEELAAIHAALRVHGDEGRPELRDPVVTAYGELLERAPALAPDMADDLTRWQRFDHAASFAALLESDPVDLVTATRIRSHLRAAEAAPIDESEPARRGVGMPLVLVGGLLLIALAIPFLGRRPRPPEAEPREHPEATRP